jgi:hypothetical protein
MHTARPLTAPPAVVEVIDSVLHDLANGDGTVRSVEVVVETREDSDTPLGDSIAGTSSEPLPAGRRADDGNLLLPEGAPRVLDDDDEDVPTLTPGGQA